MQIVKATTNHQIN